ncbi:IPTL-CTERM sorting domain-containing protein [Ottowia sp. GY511]|uniref:IPTL-CTERM sorting domain-containing protein n=1 Tax=Ottowia flava TaxID=2675430 RepID=A0ABW4KSB6_9BURK|nr:IPTL-CTERM sorting domain-containing protein [Ottowia sp. GY511]TXK22008.1 IPTL-CTERM sorting domain-containing protein [Ottowia sp. GY511]
MSLRRTRLAGIAASCLLASTTLYAQTTVSGSLSATDPVFDRTQTASPCTTPTGTYAYDTYPITHAGGTLDISMNPVLSPTGLLDPVVQLHREPFVPSSPCTSFIAEGSDVSGTDWSDVLSGTHAAGNYVIVATTVAPTDIDTQQFPLELALGDYTLTHNAAPRAAPPVAVPALGEWMLIAMGCVLAATAARRQRRERVTAKT